MSPKKKRIFPITSFDCFGNTKNRDNNFKIINCWVIIKQVLCLWMLYKFFDFIPVFLKFWKTFLVLKIVFIIFKKSVVLTSVALFIVFANFISYFLPSLLTTIFSMILLSISLFIIDELYNLLFYPFFPMPKASDFYKDHGFKYLYFDNK